MNRQNHVQTISLKTKNGDAIFSEPKGNGSPRIDGTIINKI